jgi:hypothetical protein
MTRKPFTMCQNISERHHEDVVEALPSPFWTNGTVSFHWSAAQVYEFIPSAVAVSLILLVPWTDASTEYCPKHTMYSRADTKDCKTISKPFLACHSASENVECKKGAMSFRPERQNWTTITKPFIACQNISEIYQDEVADAMLKAECTCGAACSQCFVPLRNAKVSSSL